MSHKPRQFHRLHCEVGEKYVCVWSLQNIIIMSSSGGVQKPGDRTQLAK